MKNNAHFMMAFIVGALLTFSGCAGMLPYNSIEDTSIKARQLGLAMSSTEWETTFPFEMADFIEFIDNDRVLVGTVAIEKWVGGTSHKQIVLYDANSGKPLWEARRKSMLPGIYTLLYTEPEILLMGSNKPFLRFMALDPKTGTLIWERKTKAPYASTLSDDESRLFILSTKGSKGTAEAIDTRTGTTIWSVEIADGLFEKKKAPMLLSGKDAIHILGKRLASLAQKDGRVLWTTEHDTLKSDDVSARVLDEGILIRDDRSMALLRPKDGKVLWSSKVKKGGVKLNAYLGNRLYRVVGTISGDLVQAINPKNGKLLWSRKADGFIVSHLAFEKGRLLFTTSDSVVGLSASDGRRILKKGLPKAFKAGSPSVARYMGQPDILYFHEGKLYISRERSGVAAYSFPKGNRLWHQLNYPMEIDFYSADGRFEMMMASLSLHGLRDLKAPSMSRSSTGAASFSSITSKALLQNQQSGFDRQQQNLAYMKQRSDRVLANRGASRLDRQSAIEGRKLAAGLGIANTRMSMATGQLQAATQLGSALIGAGAQMAKALTTARLQAIITREKMQTQGGHYMRTRRFQGGYYLRPFLDQGRGVTIVDLKSGKRHDLIFSPFIEELLLLGTDLQTLAVDTAGKRLLMVGVGLKPDGYETYLKLQWPLARPSLLAYDLNALRFSKITARAARERLARSLTKTGLEGQHFEKADILLLMFAASGDIERVRFLLDQGVDINAQQGVYWDMTPLIMAAMNGQVEMVRLLIERGADVNLKAYSGYFSALKLIRGQARQPLIFARQFKVDDARKEEIRKMLIEAGAKK